MQQAQRTRPGKPELSHVTDIEEADLLSHCLMLGEHAGPILHRHRIAGERHDPRTGGDMRGVECGVLQRRVCCIHTKRQDTM